MVRSSHRLVAQGDTKAKASEAERDRQRCDGFSDKECHNYSVAKEFERRPGLVHHAAARRSFYQKRNVVSYDHGPCLRSIGETQRFQRRGSSEKYLAQVDKS